MVQPTGLLPMDKCGVFRHEKKRLERDDMVVPRYHKENIIISMTFHDSLNTCMGSVSVAARRMGRDCR
ncbi:hypothetical protein CQ12_13980 [Bradyrhizobium jicamae]|uniref:Uncharacterized protein n=1 Tax=Bradyrhizobium jicamae TaxID=280332 RepID=A0A0R3LVJ6_9BRAD|nr:hypothetical protein CQ12_13980 [Bradyrhizobium jicamae]